MSYAVIVRAGHRDESKSSLDAADTSVRATVMPALSPQPNSRRSDRPDAVPRALDSRRIKSENRKMLVGIAKLAAESGLLESKRQVEYFELPARSLLNRTKPGMPFEWAINPRKTLARIDLRNRRAQPCSEER
jgi:hypothetical protein